MGYDSIPYEKRIKENIRNYSLSNLYSMEIVKKYFYNLSKVLEINILLTDRHGEKEMSIGDSFLGYHPDVVAQPGRKLRIRNHTIGHLYIKELGADKDKQLIDEMVDSTMALLEKLGEEVYLRREDSIYLEELEKELEDKRHKISQNEKEDVLTGVYNKIYFEEKMKLIDRSEVIPVGVVDVNINDWKYANDHFGDDGSDRLIRIVADILKEMAQPDYVIGRTDGDVFGVLIPIAKDGEAEEFAAKVQERCNTYEDAELAPSVAVGVVYKTNIEETLEERLSDAEYEMFNNKFEVKNAPGYRERLEKALKGERSSSR
ncbi:GGDEF domain-containing protein [Parablautia muri]|uniref:GGDEF domain-containing protein n=1 Tax=Parablautia muri TaxID=2320879 RepID=A0A9X5BII5_9FIRM|nr:GGDEF domain-containing protein [Parablautia muri]NBJ94725.1 GGDEF domain-containing protein [Parablautia muri]